MNYKEDWQRVASHGSARMAHVTTLLPGPHIMGNGKPQLEKKPVWVVLSDFLYGQVIKHQQRERMVELERRVFWGEEQQYQERLKKAGLSGRINTAFDERIDLTSEYNQFAPWTAGMICLTSARKKYYTMNMEQDRVQWGQTMKISRFYFIILQSNIEGKNNVLKKMVISG